MVKKKFQKHNMKACTPGCAGCASASTWELELAVASKACTKPTASSSNVRRLVRGRAGSGGQHNNNPTPLHPRSLHPTHVAFPVASPHGMYIYQYFQVGSWEKQLHPAALSALTGRWRCA